MALPLVIQLILLAETRKTSRLYKVVIQQCISFTTTVKQQKRNEYKDGDKKFTTAHTPIERKSNVDQGGVLAERSSPSLLPVVVRTGAPSPDISQ